VVQVDGPPSLEAARDNGAELLIASLGPPLTVDLSTLFSTERVLSLMFAFSSKLSDVTRVVVVNSGTDGGIPSDVAAFASTKLSGSSVPEGPEGPEGPELSLGMIPDAEEAARGAFRRGRRKLMFNVKDD
jgi:hypothetical protein